MTYPDSTVAIIGTGTIGSTLAAEFAAGGQDFRQLAPQRKSPKSGDSRSP